jgi:hypothetical protein
MRSSSREEVVEVFDALGAAMKRALDLSFDVLTTPERLTVLLSCEELRRQLPAVEHPLINHLSDQADPAELGGTLAPGRWPTGCASPAQKRPGGFTKPPIWVSVRL